MADLSSDLEDVYNRIDDVANQIDGSINDVGQQVELIHGGFERLTNSNTQLTSRIDSIAHTLARLEAHLFADKPNGKTAARLSSSGHQVCSIPLNHSPENIQLGYRGIENAFENRTGMLRKLELPHFDGKYPNIWINRAERLFRLGNYSDQDKFDLILVSFKGFVLTWFNIELLKDLFQDWDHFKLRFINHFTKRMDSDPEKKLFAICQKVEGVEPLERAETGNKVISWDESKEANTEVGDEPTFSRITDFGSSSPHLFEHFRTTATGEEKGDETTLSVEEELAKADSADPVDEIALLQKESEMPIEELLARYKEDICDKDLSEDDSGYSCALSEDLVVESHKIRQKADSDDENVDSAECKPELQPCSAKDEGTSNEIK